MPLYVVEFEGREAQQGRRLLVPAAGATFDAAVIQARGFLDVIGQTIGGNQMRRWAALWVPTGVMEYASTTWTQAGGPR